jgi:small subunit ribosomal protein S4
MKLKATTKIQENAEKERGNHRRSVSEYGRQLAEKQAVKQMYGVGERQFKRFFNIATKSKEATGHALLSLIERRLDNAIYRLKLAISRAQARQIIVHGHVLVNGKKVYSPAYLVEIGDVITIDPKVFEKNKEFVERVIEKRLKIGIKVPEWLELDKKEHKGQVLRYPVRSDITVPIEEHLIVELYSK